MSSIIDRLFYNYYKPPEFADEQEHIDEAESSLKQDFSKLQRKLLLRITDNMDLVCEKTSRHSFQVGFILGCQLGAEVYQTNSGVFDEYEKLMNTPLYYCQEETE